MSIRLLVVLLVWCSLSVPAKANEFAFAVPGTAVIDGVVDEVWSNAKPVSTLKIVNEQTGESDKKAKAMASVRWMWNEKHLFFLADVKDSVINTSNGNSWEQDSLEIFVDENQSKKNGFDFDDCQFRFSAIGVLSTGINGSEKNIEFQVVPMTGGYRIEGAIACKSIKLNEGRKIGLEIQVNDDPGTGKRESISKWANAENDSWQKTLNYGTLVLVDKRPVATSGKESQRQDSSPIRKVVAKTVSTTAKRESPAVPRWARDAIFYQIFPERFRNGDTANDPTHATLEFPDVVPQSWRVTPWTKQWYARSAWEKEMGNDFYEDGVFHRRYGGDLQGVLDKLDYIADLGVNAIYFNPVFYAKSLHKYDGNSFHHIDPQFGPDPKGDFKLMAAETADPKTWNWTAADRLFLKLINEAHKRKIRIIIDGVFNHTGRDFFAFQDIADKQEKSNYTHWYMIESFDHPDTVKNEFKYKGWWGVETLPEFADNAAGDDLHPEPKQYIMQATGRWMDPNADGDPGDGIDGWRLDVANEVPNKFWRDWNRHVRTINAEAYTVAEIWDNASNYLADCGFSATMNYHGFAFPSKGFLIDGRSTATEFADAIRNRMNEHAPNVRFALQNLFDSHDTDRLASMIVNAKHARKYTNSDRFDYDVGERVSKRGFKDYDINGPTKDDKQILKLAALFQMTFVGAPMVYYGTEVGMDGADDPDDRMPMVWDDLDYEPRTIGPGGESIKKFDVSVDHQLLSYYKHLIRLRTDNSALRRGDFRIEFVDDDAKVLVFSRTEGAETLLVALNRGPGSYAVGIGELGDIVTDQMALIFDSSDLKKISTRSNNGAEDKLKLAALSGRVWRLKKSQ